MPDGWTTLLSDVPSTTKRPFQTNLPVFCLIPAGIMETSAVFSCMIWAPLVLIWAPLGLLAGPRHGAASLENTTATWTSFLSFFRGNLNLDALRPICAFDTKLPHCNAVRGEGPLEPHLVD